MKEAVEFVGLLDFLLSRNCEFFRRFLSGKAAAVTIKFRSWVSVISLISVVRYNMSILKLRHGVFEVMQWVSIFFAPNLSQTESALEFRHKIRISQSFEHFVRKNNTGNTSQEVTELKFKQAFTRPLSFRNGVEPATPKYGHITHSTACGPRVVHVIVGTPLRRKKCDNLSETNITFLN